jgi:DnaJ-domain-containing protein 1
VRLLYRLGRQAGSGVLTLAPPSSRAEVYVLRRGAAVCGEGEPARRALAARLVRSVAEPSVIASFDGGVTAYPPGAVHQVGLAGWVRAHLEAQLDAALAERLVRELAGARLALRAELVPEPLDEADRRMLAALAEPRRLDEIWPLARVPRFRLLAFLHFARSIGGLAAGPVAAPVPGPRTAIDPRRRAALRLLEIDDGADAETVKRAYRRLARALHPDLQPEADDQRRRSLERRFAEVTAAYEALS